MLAAERQNSILKLVNTEGSVRTRELARTLACAEETIRRDLDKLAESGLLARSHGGASAVDARGRDLEHELRRERFVEEKRAIGREAATLVRPHESILLDESSTALAMVEFLPEEMPLRVITPSLLVARRVATHRNHELIQLGGVFDPVSVSFGGLLAELAISRLKIDRFFFSCTGIDAVHGATEPSEDRARTKQRIIELSGWNCALADHSKIGAMADYVFAVPGEINCLVTDRPIDQGVAAALHAAGMALRMPGLAAQAASGGEP